MRGYAIEVLDRTTMNGTQLLARLTREAHRYDAIVLDGSVGLRAAYVDLVAAGRIVHQRRGPIIVLADCTWKRGSWWLDRAACRIGLRIVDDERITYCVLSTDEVRLFPQTWNVSPERVAYTPWCYTLPPEELQRPTSDDGGVFAGGDSMRDYGVLLEAAHGLQQRVTIAAGWKPKNELPENVHIGSVPHNRFVELMRRASVVVVPLQPGAERSAGQQTYLNAMAMGKAVVVTDGPGARDYIRDGETGIIVPPGDSGALSAAIRWVVDPMNRVAVEQMRNRSHSESRQRFSPSRYADSILEVVRNSLSRQN